MFPIRLYQCIRLSMGVRVAPDIAQHVITHILSGLNITEYMDDCGIWTDGSFEEHMDLVDQVLWRLDDNGMKCNPVKCDWDVEETDFLGYWMTHNAVKPMKKKIDAILKMDRPRNPTWARSFIRAVDYYKFLWPRLAHVLALLNDLTGQKEFRWDPRNQSLFDEMKDIIASDCINVYPAYTSPF